MIIYVCACASPACSAILQTCPDQEADSIEERLIQERHEVLDKKLLWSMESQHPLGSL